MRSGNFGRIIIFLFAVVAGCTSGDQSGNLKYIEEDQPGLIPRLFSPGFISLDTTNERDFCFTPDFREVYFTRNARIHVSRRDDTAWSEPEPVSFSSDAFDFEAFVTQDNRHIYFISNRPTESDTIGTYQMYGVERTDSGWTAAERLTEEGDFYPTVTDSGRIYFTSADNDLYRAMLVDGEVVGREKLGDSVNTDRDEYNAFVAPDESYIILTTTGWGRGYGGGDLYVSFRTGENSWSRPRNMGPGINSAAQEYCPNVTPDGKYLFFSSRRGQSEDIYWVDAGIIETVRAEDLDFVDALLDSYRDGGIDGLNRKYGNLTNSYSHIANYDGSIFGTISLRLMLDQDTKGAAAVLKHQMETSPGFRSSINDYRLALLENDANLLMKAEDVLRRESETGVAGTEANINALGYQFIVARLTEPAMRSLKLNTILFPEAFNTWDSYGEVLLLTGDTTAAVVSYKKSLELEANNRNATRILTELGAI